MRLVSLFTIVSVSLGGAIIGNYAIVKYVKKQAEEQIRVRLDEKSREIDARETQVHHAYSEYSPFKYVLNARLERARIEEDKLYRERDIARATPEFPKEG